MKGSLETTIQATRAKNYFKYQMKDTNQLLKEMFPCNASDASTGLSEIKEEYANHAFMSKILTSSLNSQSANLEPCKETKFRESSFNEPCPRYAQKDFEHSDQLSEESDNFVFSNENQLKADQLKRVKQEKSLEDFMLQPYFGEEEDIDDPLDSEKQYNQRNRSRQLENQKSPKVKKQVDSKRQKKGLANISLQVKRIVQQRDKMTYKEVSDEVLKRSQKLIARLSMDQQQKQTKNIKRRVYDALNVLVAVGILGKQHRSVCRTQWTQVPGKRLAKQWDQVNQKIDSLRILKKQCKDKKALLDFMVEKFNSLSALQNKNRIQVFVKIMKIQQQRLQQLCRQQGKEFTDDQFISFPLLVFYSNAKEECDDKLTIEFDQKKSDQSDDSTQIIRISGKNMGIMGDLDFTTQLDLEKFRDIEAQYKLLQDLENCTLDVEDSQDEDEQKEEEIIKEEQQEKVQCKKFEIDFQEQLQNDSHQGISKYLGQASIFDQLDQSFNQ